MTDNLGPRLSTKPLHVFWLLDVSGSMAVNGKIEALNQAMREAIDAVREAAAENPGTQVIARVITFAHDAEWHVPEPTDIEHLTWSEIAVVEGGTTELGLAVGLVTEAIREVASAGRGLPPAMILVSDGKPTDLKRPSYSRALRELDDEPWGRKASRIAIGIGQDADMKALQRFTGHDELPPIRAESAGQLAHYLRWASTVVVDDRSRPAFSFSDDSDMAATSLGRNATELRTNEMPDGVPKTDSATQADTQPHPVRSNAARGEPPTELPSGLATSREQDEIALPLFEATEGITSPPIASRPDQAATVTTSEPSGGAEEMHTYPLREPSNESRSEAPNADPVTANHVAEDGQPIVVLENTPTVAAPLTTPSETQPPSPSGSRRDDILPPSEPSAELKESPAQVVHPEALENVMRESESVEPATTLPKAAPNFEQLLEPAEAETIIAQPVESADQRKGTTKNTPTEATETATPDTAQTSASTDSRDDIVLAVAPTVMPDDGSTVLPESSTDDEPISPPDDRRDDDDPADGPTVLAGTDRDAERRSAATPPLPKPTGAARADIPRPPDLAPPPPLPRDDEERF